MAPRPYTSFQTFALEQLARAQAITAKRMFGGVGVYHAGAIFALMDDDALWFKVDDTNRADFEARGMAPFLPFGPDGPAMAYWQVPEDVLEDIDALRQWCEKAIVVSRGARARRVAPASPRKKRR